ncbi:hypothetical protein SNEBB_004938, partial [Seison nebaliae]
MQWFLQRALDFGWIVPDEGPDLEDMWKRMP